jgi:hypothetical protein
MAAAAGYQAPLFATSTALRAVLAAAQSGQFQSSAGLRIIKLPAAA